MSLPSRSEVVSLLRSLLRTAQSFTDYNVRDYVRRRSGDAFRHNRSLSDPAAVSAAFSDGKSQLEIAKRQAVIYEIYSTNMKSVMESRS